MNREPHFCRGRSRLTASSVLTGSELRPRYFRPYRQEYNNAASNSLAEPISIKMKSKRESFRSALPLGLSKNFCQGLG